MSLDTTLWLFNKMSAIQLGNKAKITYLIEKRADNYSSRVY